MCMAEPSFQDSSLNHCTICHWGRVECIGPGMMAVFRKACVFIILIRFSSYLMYLIPLHKFFFNHVFCYYRHGTKRPGRPYKRPWGCWEWIEPPLAQFTVAFLSSQTELVMTQYKQLKWCLGRCIQRENWLRKCHLSQVYLKLPCFEEE